MTDGTVHTDTGKTGKKVVFYTKSEIARVLATKGNGDAMRALAGDLGKTFESVQAKWYGLKKKALIDKADKKNQTLANQASVLPVNKATEMIQKAALREFKQSPATPVSINGLVVRFPNNEFIINDVKITW